MIAAMSCCGTPTPAKRRTLSRIASVTGNVFLAISLLLIIACLAARSSKG
jgi:hypothetical protein